MRRVSEHARIPVSAQAAMHCDQAQVLWERYRLAFKKYLDARSAAFRSGTGSGIAQAKFEFESLWDQYCEHVVEHRCRERLVPFIKTAAAAASTRPN